MALPSTAQYTPNFGAANSMVDANTVFPLLQSSIKIDNSGWSIDTATNSGGATLTHAKGGTPGLTLSIPSLNVTDKPVKNDAAAALNLLNGASSAVLMAVNVWSDVIAGQWFVWDGSKGTLSQFVTGFRAGGPALQGKATYAAKNNVEGYALQAKNVAVLNGDATLNADFQTGAITGTLKNMTATDTNATQTAWNDVAITGSIRSDNMTFAGKTSATSAPGTSFAVKSDATGTTNGGFYGPYSWNVAGVWSIGDGTTSAFGTFGGNSDPFIINPPLAPSFGYTQATPIMATSGGPTFDSASGNYPTGTFPALQTTLGTGPIKTVTYPGYATNSVSFQDNGPSCPTCKDTNFTLTVPGVGVTATGKINNNLSAVTTTTIDSTPAGKTSPYSFSLVSYGLSYTSFGVWTQSQNDFGKVDYTGTYLIGMQTPVGNLPTSGSATYAGAGMVAGEVIVPNGATFSAAGLQGDASMTANFSTGAVTGNFSNMNAYVGTQKTPWNSVSFTGNIATGSNSFSGTTTATSGATGTFALKPDAAGAISGGFYGPNANELAGVWTLSNGDNTGAAIGTVGGRKQ
ncbi:hypothetical protein GCM10008941_16590 [Rhizomicrobium palustre]